jgi:hypothetical protein
MVLTNEQIVKIVVELAGIVGDSDLKLPASVSYAILRNYKLLEPIAKDVLEAKETMLSQYGTPKSAEDGSWYYDIKPEYIEEANIQLKELSEMETEAAIVQVPIEAFRDCTLSLHLMDSLYFMIEDGEG